MCHFGENCMGVRRAQIYHLKWVEKNHARLCKFLLQAFVCFDDVLIRSCLFLIVPEMLKICLYIIFLKTFHIRFILLSTPLLWNIHIRGQYPNSDSRKAFIMFLLCFKSINGAIREILTRLNHGAINICMSCFCAIH